MNITNPLGTYPEHLREHLERQFYRPVTITEYDRCLSALNNKKADLGIGLKDLEGAAGDLIANPTVLHPIRNTIASWFAASSGSL